MPSCLRELKLQILKTQQHVRTSCPRQRVFGLWPCNLLSVLSREIEKLEKSTTHWFCCVTLCLLTPSFEGIGTMLYVKIYIRNLNLV